LPTREAERLRRVAAEKGVSPSKLIRRIVVGMLRQVPELGEPGRTDRS
jgi:hypothetical protein